MCGSGEGVFLVDAEQVTISTQIESRNEHSFCSITTNHFPFSSIPPLFGQLVSSCVIVVFVFWIVILSLFCPPPGELAHSLRFQCSKSIKFLFLPQRSPVRICQTCGLAKTLDHFVSMYTEASTTNCDTCRLKQREVYRRIAPTKASHA